MEVHHHAHTSRKKWTHYFWEFLMLFLAVFCGFLAEYQLEHKIEKERVKKLMSDMVENLKYDTTRIGRNAPQNTDLKKDLDSFRLEIKEAIQGRVNSNRLYYFYLKSQEFGNSFFNKAAITQLKSSGLLRLVKNDSLVNELLDYYERKVAGSEAYRDEVMKARDAMTQYSTDVFKTTGFEFASAASDTTWSSSMTEQYHAYLASVLTMNNLDLLSKAPADLERLHSAALRFEWNIIYYNRFLHLAREAAVRLIILIDELY